MKRIQLVILILLLLPVFSAQAVRINDLYQALITVPNESEAVQKSALRSAMAIVLVKLTGDRQAVNRPEFSDMLAEAEKYTRQYGYKQYTDATGTQRLQLAVQFEENLINNAFRERGLLAWGKERPSVLLWLAEIGFGNDRLLGLESGQHSLDIIDRRSKRRGLGLVLPLLDLQDTAQIKPADVVTANSAVITSASDRYPADAVLAGTIESLAQDNWRARWTSVINNTVSTFTTNGNSREAALEQGMDLMADRVAAVYARTTLNNTTASHSSEIIVSNINSADDYARALQYLRGLNTVTDVQVKQLYDDKVSFSIDSLGGMSAISQAINLGNTLESLSADASMFRLSPY